MAYFEFNGKKLFIDNRLKDRLDKKIVPDLKKKDMDCVFAVDGRERIGKSVFAMTIGAYMSSVFKKNFDLSNICFSPLEFRNKVIKASKNEVVIYDEAYGGLSSSGSLSEINRLLKSLMMEMGQKNLLIFVLLPTFFLLEKYVALFRARGLFHIYSNKGRRGFWVYYNRRNKKRLYLFGKKEFNYNCMRYPKLRGVFTNQYPINEEEYRAKKAREFKKNKRTTKEEKYRIKLQKTMAALHDEFSLSARKLSSLLKKYGIVRSHVAILRDIRTYSLKEKTKELPELKKTPENPQKVS